MDKFPQIKVSFVVEGKNFEMKQLTEEVGILPTETRGREDWPEAIKSNKNLPESLQPRCIWCICQTEDSCKQIEIPIQKMVLQLNGKEQKLIKYCKKNNLKKSMSIVIHADTMNLPEIVLSSYMVSYFGKLDVEIGFDIYTY